VAPLLPCWLCQLAPPAPLPPVVFLFHTALPRLPPHTPSICMCVARACDGQGAGGACVGLTQSTHVAPLLPCWLCLHAPPAPLPPGVFLLNAALPRLPPHTPSMCMCVARAWRGQGGRGGCAGGVCVRRAWSTLVWHLLSPNSLHYITVSASPTCTPVPRRVPLLHHPAQTLSLSMCAARVCWGREAVGMCVMRARSTPRAAPLSSTVDCLPRLPPHRLHLNVCCQSVVGLGCRLHICGAVCVEYPRVARYAPCGRPDRHPCPPSSTPSPRLPRFPPHIPPMS
jgi:hypothetical protein